MTVKDIPTRRRGDFAASAAFFLFLTSISLPELALRQIGVSLFRGKNLQLKELLITHRTSLPPRDLKNFYIISINFSIKQLNTGHPDYVRQAFELYQKALEVDVLLDRGILSQFHYKNIAALGLDLKAYDWVEQFLIAYRDKLLEQSRTLNFNYNFAKQMPDKLHKSLS